MRSLALRPLEPLVDALGHHALQTDQGQPVAHEQGEKYEHAESGQNDHDGEEESDDGEWCLVAAATMSSASKALVVERCANAINNCGISRHNYGAVGNFLAPCGAF